MTQATTAPEAGQDGQQTTEGSDATQTKQSAPSMIEQLTEKAKQWEGQSATERRRTSRAVEEESGEEAAPAGPQGESSDTDQSATQRTDAPDSPQPGTEDKAKSPDSGEQAQPDADRLEKAKHALKRNQWSDEDIEKLSQDRLLDRGEKLLKREQDREQMANERARFRQFLKEEGYDPDNLAGKSESTQQKQESAGQDDQAGEADSIKQSLYERIDAIKPGDDSMMDEKEWDSIKQGFKSVVDGLVDHYESRSPATQDNGQQQAAADTDGQQEQASPHPDQQPAPDRWTRQQESIAMDNEIIASDMTAEFEGLKEPDTRQQVKERARRLVQGDQHGDLYYDTNGDPRWDEAVRDAATLVIGQSKPDPQQAKADMLDRQQQHQASRPSFDNETGGKQTTVSRKDAMRQLWEARQKGKPEGEIQRLRKQLSNAAH